MAMKKKRKTPSLKELQKRWRGTNESRRADGYTHPPTTRGPGGLFKERE